MEQTIDLKPLALAEEDVFRSLSDGRMIVLRSGRDFLYILRRNEGFFMFSHTPGNPEGGRKKMPQDEKSLAIVKNLIKIADSAYEVSFAEDMDVRGVMVSAEEGILELFPIKEDEGGADIEFAVPGESGAEAQERE